MTPKPTTPLAWIALLLLPLAAAAAPPTLPGSLTYQGVLLDDQGQPRTGVVDLTLRIYDALSGGTLLYAETLVSVPLTDGVFSIEVGPTGAASDPPNPDPLSTSLAEALAGDLPATAPSRFLEVTVGSEGPLARIQVLTVPYALRAGSAELADQADVATTALSAGDATSVGGLDASFVTQIYEHTNLDESGPPNSDPREGLGDTDLDGVANFLDADNDGDGLSDSAELTEGSDINLVTPDIVSLDPASSFSQATRTVTVTGANFEPGLVVAFGNQAPPPSDLTPTSFEVEVGPQPPGAVDVQVTRLNGETATQLGAYTFFDGFGSHSVASNSASQWSFDVASASLVVSGGQDGYQVDADDDGTAETDFPFADATTTGQVAVGFDGADTLAGIRCRNLNLASCAVEVARDADADAALADETGVALETLGGANPHVRGPAVAFDPSDRVAVAYKALSSSNDPGTLLKVAHDRDGDGLFSGTNEHVTVSGDDVGDRNEVDIAVDAAGRVAVAWMASAGAGDAELEVAWDRSGDGDFADSPGGNPERFLVTTGTLPTFACVGVGFAPDGDLAVVTGVFNPPAVRFWRDRNGDGDFADADESLLLSSLFTPDCDLDGDATSVAVGYVEGSDVRLLVDRNDDGDFQDAEESQVVATNGSDVQRLGVAHDPAGNAYLATTGEVGAKLIYLDPGAP